MPNEKVTNNQSSIDPAWLAKIVSEVLARLDAGIVETNNDLRNAKVIDAKTVEQYPPGSSLQIHDKAIITPAAKDEAKRRDITLIRATIDRAKRATPSTNKAVCVETKHDRIDAVRAMLARRGITTVPANVVLSDTPARDVAAQFGRSKSATMVGSIGEVSRFEKELNPNVWVLDMQRMNLMTTVNVVVAITRLGGDNE